MAGGLGLRCATSAACLLSGLMCSFNRVVHSEVALAQANIDEETCTVGEDIAVKYRVRRIIICSDETG